MQNLKQAVAICHDGLCSLSATDVALLTIFLVVLGICWLKTDSWATDTERA
jgi:hypothetical protein